MARLFFFGRKTLSAIVPESLVVSLFCRDNIVFCADRHPLVPHISELPIEPSPDGASDTESCLALNRRYGAEGTARLYIGKDGSAPSGWVKTLPEWLIKEEWIDPQTVCGLWQPHPNVFLSTAKRAAIEYGFRSVIQIQLRDAYALHSLTPTFRLCWRHDIPFRPEHLDRVISFIEKNGEPVLFHCDASNDRSPSLLAAYLVRTKGLSLDECEMAIQKVHPWQIKSVEGHPIEDTTKPWKLNRMLVEKCL